MNSLQFVLWLQAILLKCYWALNYGIFSIWAHSVVKIAIFTYDLQFILINIKDVKGVHYSWQLDDQFTVCVMTVSHSPQMLLSFKFAFETIFMWKIAIFTYDLQFILINIKKCKRCAL